MKLSCTKWIHLEKVTLSAKGSCMAKLIKDLHVIKVLLNLHRLVIGKMSTILHVSANY
jgi:hypothetical protein